MTFHTKQKST